MNREQAIKMIRSEWRTILPQFMDRAAQKVNGEDSFICPFCGHGTHGDGLTVNKRSTDQNGLKCFGCGWAGDVIDLCQKAGDMEFNETVELLARTIGADITPYQPTDANKPAQEKRINPAKKEEHAQDQQEETADYTAYYRKCAKNLTDPAAISYLMGRGISKETAAAYMVGYDPASDPANAPGALTDEEKLHPVKRIIIPTTKSHYIGRSIDPETAKQYAKMNPNRSKGAGAAGIFNALSLYAQKVQEVFVVEGAFDALSIIEAGASAISLNSTSNAEQLLSMLKERPTAATLILCLDNDDAGKRATDTLKQGLQRLNISYVAADICGGHKDPNEHLKANRAAFFDAVEQAQRMTAARPDNVSYYIDNLMSGDISKFKSEIKTGFADLDKKSGGIYAGLYVVAAVSSLGKTTFTAQMADQIATAGTDVLFFSMEQSKLEMVSKSIARKTFINGPSKAVSSLSIRKGYLPQEVRTAAAQYKQEVQDHISIIEGNFACNISFIGDYVRQYIRKNNTRPVIMVDYLQVLQPEQQNGRQQTAKETVDAAIVELKRLSRGLSLPIIVISSVNRANYLTPIDFESLKESGSIEYTCDVLWGLQLQCLNDPLFTSQTDIKERRERIKQEKSATPRKIELVCLKNRYGVSSFNCYFDYYPAHDFFEESKDIEAEYKPTQTARKAGRKL